MEYLEISIKQTTMKNQGKRKEQITLSEKVVLSSFVLAVIILLILKFIG
jgi:cell division protein FtsL